MKKQSKQPVRPRQDRLNTLFIALVMVGAVILGLLLPSMTVYIQGRATERTERQVELGVGALSLTSDDAKLERLQMISIIWELEMNGEPAEIVELSNGRFMDAGAAINKLSEVMALTEGSGLPMANFTTADLNFVDVVLMVADTGNMMSTILWTVDFSKSTGENLYYVLDDSTGTIVAVDYYYGLEAYEAYIAAMDSGEDGAAAESFTVGRPDPAQAMEALAGNLAECWNFSETEIQVQDLSETEERNPYENVYYLYLSRDGTLLLEVPVRIDVYSWGINMP